MPFGTNYNFYNTDILINGVLIASAVQCRYVPTRTATSLLITKEIHLTILMRELLPIIKSFD